MESELVRDAHILLSKSLCASSSQTLPPPYPDPASLVQTSHLDRNAEHSGISPFGNYPAFPHLENHICAWAGGGGGAKNRYMSFPVLERLTIWGKKGLQCVPRGALLWPLHPPPTPPQRLRELAGDPLCPSPPQTEGEPLSVSVRQPCQPP